MRVKRRSVMRRRASDSAILSWPVKRSMIPPQFGRVLVHANGGLEARAMALSELSQRFERSKRQHPAWATERWD
eukprot:7140167-Prymnesium_polylepis.1